VPTLEECVLMLGDYVEKDKELQLKFHNPILCEVRIKYLSVT